jgi:predicted transcriptional regulator
MGNEIGEMRITRKKDSIPWREAFPEVTDETLPGICLRGAREKEGLTQTELSRKTGIPQRHISEMENGKRPIGKKNARIYSKALNMRWKIFL